MEDVVIGDTLAENQLDSSCLSRTTTSPRRCQKWTCLLCSSCPFRKIVSFARQNNRTANILKFLLADWDAKMRTSIAVTQRICLGYRRLQIMRRTRRACAAAGLIAKRNSARHTRRQLDMTWWRASCRGTCERCSCLGDGARPVARDVVSSKLAARARALCRSDLDADKGLRFMRLFRFFVNGAVPLLDPALKWCVRGLKMWKQNSPLAF